MTDIQDDVHLPTKRKKIVLEVYKTEREYIADLEKIVTYYQKPLEEKGIITLEQSKILFCNVQDLPVRDPVMCYGGIDNQAVNRVILKDIDLEFDRLEGMKGDIGETALGRIFISFCEKDLAQYTKYCSNQPQALALITELNQINPDFEFYCRNLMENEPAIKGLSIGGYVIKPVQRLCKYPLLIRELLSVTDESKPDYAALLEAQEKVSEVVAHVNEIQREADQKAAERQADIAEIATNIEGAEDLGLVDHNQIRFLTLMGTLKVATRKPLKGSPIRTVVLFNDIIIVSAPNEKKAKKPNAKPEVLVWHSKMGNLGFVDLADSEDGVITNAFELFPKDDAKMKKKIAICCDDLASKREWIKVIRQQIKDFQRQEAQRLKNNPMAPRKPPSEFKSATLGKGLATPQKRSTIFTAFGSEKDKEKDKEKDEAKKLKKKEKQEKKEKEKLLTKEKKKDKKDKDKDKDKESKDGDVADDAVSVSSVTSGQEDPPSPRSDIGELERKPSPPLRNRRRSKSQSSLNAVRSGGPVPDWIQRGRNARAQQGQGNTTDNLSGNGRGGGLQRAHTQSDGENGPLGRGRGVHGPRGRGRPGVPLGSSPGRGSPAQLLVHMRQTVDPTQFSTSNEDTNGTTTEGQRSADAFGRPSDWAFSPPSSPKSPSNQPIKGIQHHNSASSLYNESEAESEMGLETSTSSVNVQYGTPPSTPPPSPPASPRARFSPRLSPSTSPVARVSGGTFHSRRPLPPALEQRRIASSPRPPVRNRPTPLPAHRELPAAPPLPRAPPLAPPVDEAQNGVEKLIRYAARGQLPFVIYLVETEGVSVNGKNSDDRTPLHVAASKGQLHVVRYLLSQGADSNATDVWGKTPTDSALDFGHRAVATIITREASPVIEQAPRRGRARSRSTNSVSPAVANARNRNAVAVWNKKKETTS